MPIGRYLDLETGCICGLFAAVKAVDNRKLALCIPLTFQHAGRLNPSDTLRRCSCKPDCSGDNALEELAILLRIGYTFKETIAALLVQRFFLAPLALRVLTGKAFVMLIGKPVDLDAFDGFECLVRRDGRWRFWRDDFDGIRLGIE
ncbi:MAG TPA: hypothetical protein VKA31_07410 [Mariprofundaceae bacterium]|nr:hypothetical protein [Mariprofundaceae bacterium]